MLELCLKNKLPTFAEIEKECRDEALEYGKKLMSKRLKEIDNLLAQERNKNSKNNLHFFNKGKRKTTVNTLLGSFELSRNYYKIKNKETSLCSHAFLLDNFMNIKAHKKTSHNLLLETINLVTEQSYRETAISLYERNNKKINHQSIHSLITSFSFLQVKNDELSFNNKSKIEAEVLIEEADGVYINMQGKDRTGTQGKKELKVTSFYEGFEKIGNDRYKKVNAYSMTGFEEPKEFFNKKENFINSIYDTSKIKNRLISSDGAAWIYNNYIQENSYYQIDNFHKYNAVKYTGFKKETRNKLCYYIKTNQWQQLFKELITIITLEKNKYKKKRMIRLYEYFKNNEDYLIPILERDLDLPTPKKENLIYRNPGTIESTNLNNVCIRMKQRKCSFSKKGATALSNLICLKRAGILEDYIFAT